MSPISVSVSNISAAIVRVSISVSASDNTLAFVLTIAVIGSIFLLTSFYTTFSMPMSSLKRTVRRPHSTPTRRPTYRSQTPLLPSMERSFGPRAVDVIGGQWPVTIDEFALRAYLHARNPLRNPLKEVMDAFGDAEGRDLTAVQKCPPMLGIFSDVPWHQLRESEVHAWAMAGFTWVVCDGEHSQQEGRYGREQMAMLLRHGITPVQRLHREARSEHGDALTLGARGTMAPYSSTLAEAEAYYACVAYPDPANGVPASPLSRGGFPMRKGDRSMLFTPDGLREGETETQGWLQVRSSGRGKPWRGARGKEERRERGGEGGERRGEGNEGQLSGLS
jgi:hypothetical protein